MSSWFNKIILAVIAIPIIVLLAWYAVTFLPHLSSIKDIQKQGMVEVVASENILYPIAVVADGNLGMRSYSMRTAYYTEALKGQRNNVANWHLNTALWLLASYMHFDDKEIFYLWAMYAPYEKGRGLQNSSQYYYGKPINELTIEEQVTILAIPKAPTLYKLGGERLKTRVNKIIREINT